MGALAAQPFQIAVDAVIDFMPEADSADDLDDVVVVVGGGGEGLAGFGGFISAFHGVLMVNVELTEDID